MKKTKISVILLILAITISTIAVAMPFANAHEPPWTVPTYAFIEVNPNPVGVGQTVYLSFWLDKVPPTAIAGYGMMWHNFKVTVTDPDGHTDDLGTYSSDATGGAWDQYVPEEVGTYTFKFEFPGQEVQLENPYPYPPGFIDVGTAFINDTYTGSSASTELIVQEEPIESAYSATPLPTEYWVRPINSMNREWYSIGGNWLGSSFDTYSAGSFKPYTTGPNSAHVLWTKPIAFGGQIGGEFGADDRSIYATGTAYEAKFKPVIINGILYYTEYPEAGNNPTGLKAMDIRTGQTIWTKPITTAALNLGQIQQFITGNQYGAHAYLWTAPVGGFTLDLTHRNWEMYDAMTGEWILDIANVSAGTLVMGDNGEILSYAARGGMLSLWNSSKCIEVGSQKNNFYIVYSAEEIWRPPRGTTLDWNDGYEWSVPVATNITGVPIVPSLGLSVISDDVVLLTAQPGGVPGASQLGYRVDAAYSAVDGSLLWGPINRTLTPFTNVAPGPAAEGVYTEYTAQTATWSGYSIETGQKLWGPTEPKESWGYFDVNGEGVIGYGNFYTWGIGGEVTCYDVHTGDELWSWSSGNAGYDTPYGSYPFWVLPPNVLADGKLYVASSHDYTPPFYKGAKLYCLNATTGEEIWSTLTFGGTQLGTSRVIADGILVSLNCYDMQIYAFGKGPSATTVSIQDDVVTHGDSVLVKGMVTDISPGTEEYVNTARFPNGVPAISDENMSAWMEYLYQQQPKPTDATGVDVTISVLDPNGNVYDVGTTTSDATGFYKLAFTPPVPGEYYVYATFSGSESYYGSSATTAINVEEAPAATAEPTPTPASVADLYFLPVSLGMIIAIIAIGLVIILMLRKR